MKTLTTKQLHRLDVQGFDRVSPERLAEVAPWQRLPYALCATLAIAGTATASVPLLAVLTGIAAIAGLSPVHPFDLIYNLGIRHMRGTGPLPRRGAPARFACGVGSLWLVATIAAFASGAATAGYALGFSLSAVALLVGTTDICVPSMIYRALFRRPVARAAE